MSPTDPPRLRDILVVDLLGGIGDLVMLLPSIHALARRHPRAAVRVLTHAPGSVLLAADPAVVEVRTAEKGDERAAVVAELERRRFDLVVSTTRYDGIPAEIERRVPRSVTDLWRRPPPDELVSRRYLRILAAEGLVDGDYAPPRIHLTDAERAGGLRFLAELVPDGTAPVVVVPDAGMAVKRWPHLMGFVGDLTGRGVPVLVLGEDVPPVDLRGLAAFFAAVGRRGGVVVGPDTGPVRTAAAVGARTVGLFGPTVAARYGLDPPSVDLQGLPGCPHRLPTAITEQVCWWDATCPLADDGPACMADIAPARVRGVVLGALGDGSG
jgi:glycosyl transferase family 9 (putative heptosyltransferase)